MQNWRCDDYDFVIPNYGVAVSAAKIRALIVIYNSASGEVETFDQANFGGSGTSHSVSGTGDTAFWEYWDIGTPTKGTTHHYSIRNKPYDANPANHQPDPDNYRPPDVNLTYDGYQALLKELSVQLDFDYQ